MTPTSPIIGETVTCTTTVDEPDLEATTETIIWTNDTTGLAIGSGASIVLDISKAVPSEQISCEVTVRDPSGGSVTEVASTTVVNEAPVITSLTLSQPAVAIGDHCLHGLSHRP